VASAARSAGLSDPILWTSLPTAVDLAGSLGEKAVVYYCGDDFGALAGVDHEPVVRLERELVDRADMILAASPQLAERFPGSKTHLLPHGVDLSLFSQPAPRAPELPGDGPVAGFYGSLAEWLDLDLIVEAAGRLPHWRFVLIGEVRTDVTALRGISNISLPGPRPHGTLPSFSQHWQASLLPFKDNAQIRASNPLKLREYLAAGPPVVATDFPALNGYRDLFNVVKGPDELAATLEATLAEPSVLVDARRERVAGESWSARADQVAGLLETLH
jgi:glycosyltransferase involved in cell wall biosynthesis